MGTTENQNVNFFVLKRTEILLSNKLGNRIVSLNIAVFNKGDKKRTGITNDNCVWTYFSHCSPICTTFNRSRVAITPICPLERRCTLPERLGEEYCSRECRDFLVLSWVRAALAVPQAATTIFIFLESRNLISCNAYLIIVCRLRVPKEPARYPQSK